jgi:hypothetical protein
MIKFNRKYCKAKISLKLIPSIFLFVLAGCYSLLPLEEIDNGIVEDSRTWKFYQLIWKPGEKPKLETMLKNYYSKDCNEGCVYEYVLTVNFIEELNSYQIKKYGENIPEGSSIILSENDTCGSNSCKGRWIPYKQLLGELKEEIRQFEGKKRRIPVNANESTNPTTWNYFRILVKTADDTIFSILQDELSINPKLESYSLIVNVSDINPQNQFVVIGDEADPSALRWSWSQLSKKTQDGLLNWTKPNKQNFSIFNQWR